MRPDSIIEVESEFQRIRLRRHPYLHNEVILYCDDMWQFDSSLERKYHEAIATLPACATESLEHVLICGGGDGLAARSLLQFPEVQDITLVEIDPEMIRLFSREPLTELNRGSLNDPRVKVCTQDAIRFASQATRSFYDLIILDFPSPGKRNLSKSYENLFTPEILGKFLPLLKPWGVLSAQVGIPIEILYSWVQKAVEDGFYCWQYDVAYNSRSIDSIAVLCKNRLTLRRSPPHGSQWATSERVNIGFSDTTELGKEQLEYYRLFETVEGIEEDNDPYGSD